MLIISAEIVDKMIAHLRQLYPEEGCGLLGGRGQRVESIYPIENIDHSRTTFAMDPKAQIEAMLAIEAEGAALLGIFHSHPDSPPIPSPTDLQDYGYPDSAFLIVSFENFDRPTLCAYLISDGRYRRYPVEIL